MAMPPRAAGKNISLTSWLDTVLGYFADQAGISREDYVAQTGGEWIASGIEFATDMFTKGIMNKLIQGILGAVLGSYAIWGKPNPRLRKELIAMANHELTRILDPKPSDLIELRESIDKLVSAIQAKDLKLALDALFRSPEELKNMLSALGIPVGELRVEAPTAPAPVAPPAPPAPVKAEKKVTFR